MLLLWSGYGPRMMTSVLQSSALMQYTGLQVALRAMQKRLANSSSADQKAAHLAEIGRVQGALQQARAEYKQLLEQCSHHQETGESRKGRVVGMAELQAANKALTQDLAESEQHLVQSHRHLQQSQEQLQQYVQETSKLQELVEKLSTAVTDMHGAVEKAECLGQKQGAMSSNANNNLQAVHDAVQRNLSRYNSSSSERTFASSEILLPALWKPQRERHIAPTGFQ